MEQYKLIWIIETLIIFIICSLILSYLFLPATYKKPKVVKRHPIQAFDKKQIFFIFLAAFGLTVLLNSIAENTITGILIFICCICLLPYAISADQTRVKQESVFDDVVVYCQNMAMLLKQNHNVYLSLSTVQKDLETALKDDVASLISSIDEGRQSAKQSMDILEKNYPYTCISNLNVILMHMQFEDAHINDELLAIYQDDLDQLEKDVRDNKAKRKILRMQYVLISIACIAVYWIFLSQIRTTFADGFNSSYFRILNGGFLLATLITLFFVDRYFNSTITKE